MRFAAGMLVAMVVTTIYPSLAQYPPRGFYPQQEERPQGRQLRQKKYFPPQMSDCQVLDTDTAAENGRLRASRQPPPQPARAATSQTLPAHVTPPPATAVDDLYRPRPNEAYSPPTYCNWNRTGLPQAYQKICADRDQKVGVYKSDWQSIEADNGAVYRIDMNSIKPGNGGAAEIMVYADEGGASDNVVNLKFLLFDCRGRFLDMNSPAPSAYAPPKSVAGQIGAIACEKAHATTVAIDAESVRIGLSPESYCKGFSADACNRMKSVIDTKERPSFCKQGFALVGSGLTDEQLRICYVMTSTVFH
jgi:hypothetical protein